MLTPSPLTCLALLSSQIMPAYTWQKSPELNGALMIPRRIALPSSHVISLIRTWRLRIFPKKFRFFSFPFLIFFFPPQKAVPLQGAPCQGLDGSVQVGKVGPGRKIWTGARHAPIRSTSLSLPGPRRQSRRGPPGDGRAAVTLSGKWQTAAAGLAAAGPGGAGKEGPGRPRPLAAPTSPAPALRKWSGGQGTEGGWEEGRRRAPDPRRSAPPPPFAPPARPGRPRPAAGLTCVADDDVLEEIGVRHGRGRSVPGSRLLLPLCASSAPSPAPLGREPGPRPPSVAVRASSKGRGAAGRTDSAERGAQRPSPSEQ